MGPTAPAPTKTFVGRDPELTRLTALLDEAVAGRGSVALVAGEPGIGKTRLAEELSDRARGRRVPTVWGHCYEGDGAPALWPWLQILRDLLRDCPPDAVRRMPGSAAALAEIVPEIRSLLPDLGELPLLEPAQARFRLFESITGFLRARAGPSAGAGLLLILDDLQWADAASLLLLDFLAAAIADLPLLVIGTYRGIDVQSGQLLGGTLAEVARRPRSLHLTLTGLDNRQVERLAASGMAAPPSGALLAALARDTQGNPLFVIETVRLLAAERRLRVVAEDDLWRGGMPPAIQGVIEQRMARLSDRCREVLTLAAVCGPHFDLATLVGADGLPAGEVADALDEAEIAAVIAAVGTPTGRFQFTHALLRQSLYDALPRAQRALLHRRVGDTLERRQGSDPAGPSYGTLAQLAHHFMAAQDEAGAVKALEYALACAEHSARIHADEESVRLYRQAIEALERIGSADGRHRCELLLRLGEAQNRAGDTEAGKLSLLDAARAARAAGWAAGLARAAIGYGGMGEVVEAPDTVRAALLEEALGAAGPEDHATHAWLLARLVIAMASSERRGRGAALSAEAVAAARRAGRMNVLSYALSVRHLALWGPHNLAERMALATEAAQCAKAAGHAGLQLHALRCLIPDELERGELAAADHAIAEYSRLAEELRQPSYQYHATLFQAMRASVDGRYADAERLAIQAFELGRRVQHPDAIQIFGGQIAAIREAQGRLAELEGPLRALIQGADRESGYNAALAVLLLQTGRVDEARREFEQCMRDDFHAAVEERFWLSSMTFLAHLCTELGDAARAHVVYQRLWPYRDHGVVGGRAATYFGATARYLGRLAATIATGGPPPDRGRDGATVGGATIPLPDHAAAIAHFEAAIAFDSRMGARRWVAVAQCDLSEFLLRAGRDLPPPARRHDPPSLLDAALTTGRELELTALIARVERIRAAHPPAASAPAAAVTAGLPGGLNEREAAVLRLLAGGATNKQIGAALYLSADTVRRHTMHIYRKTGTTGRAEATAWAARHGLLSE